MTKSRSFTLITPNPRALRTVSHCAVVLAAVAVAPLLGARTADAQTPMTLEQAGRACEAGNSDACNALMQVARSACLNGNSAGCRVAAQVAQIQLQQQGGTYGGDANAGYPQAYDPLAPYRDTIQSTNDYIRSYCSNPRIAAQLRGFNYCQ